MVDGTLNELLLDLFETVLNSWRMKSKNIHSDLEKLSRVIMEGHQGDEYDEALPPRWRNWRYRRWKVRLCLMDTQRALNFPVRKARYRATAGAGA